MAKSLSDFLTEHPVDRDAVEAHKARMLADIEEFSNLESQPNHGEEQLQGQPNCVRSTATNSP